MKTHLVEEHHRSGPWGDAVRKSLVSFQDLCPLLVADFVGKIADRVEGFLTGGRKSTTMGQWDNRPCGCRSARHADACLSLVMTTAIDPTTIETQNISTPEQDEGASRL